MRHVLRKNLARFGRSLSAQLHQPPLVHQPTQVQVIQYLRNAPPISRFGEAGKPVKGIEALVMIDAAKVSHGSIAHRYKNEFFPEVPQGLGVFSRYYDIAVFRL